jgi:hypothetical protein
MAGLRGRRAQSARWEPLLQLDAEELGHEVTQAVARAAEQLGGDGGVEDVAGDEAAGASEQAEVEVGAVQDELALGEVREEGGEVGWREGVDERVAAGVADLDQAQLLGVRVEAVGLGVEGEPRRAAKRGDQGLDLGVVDEQHAARAIPQFAGSRFAGEVDVVARPVCGRRRSICLFRGHV